MSCPCDDYSPEYCLIHNPPREERALQRLSWFTRLRNWLVGAERTT